MYSRAKFPHCLTSYQMWFCPNFQL